MKTIGRRDFLRQGSVAGGFAAGALACGGPSSQREPLPGELSATALVTPPDVTGSELDEVTVAELQAAMTDGRLTARSVTAQYVSRIEQTNGQGPALRAVLEVNPDVLALAEERDRERAAHRIRGPLHGVPVLLKDNIDTADEMTTTAGSLALEGSVPSRDSEVARRLRAAGAILLGKANLSEWANFRSTRSSSGWSARGGQCRNPYVLDRNPCGSSSGSGVAVSANMTALAIGTETDGSIVCPSSANGIVGIKPTVGLVSRAGIIPISHSQDTAGPMTRTVRDAAVLLTVLSGVDAKDPATTAARGVGAIGDQVSVDADYTVFLDPDGLRGARVGVVRSFFGFHEAVDQVMADALEAMRDAGATVVDPVVGPSSAGLEPDGLEVLLYEFKTGLNDYLATLPTSVGVRSLAELIAFNEEHRDREMPHFGQELFLAAEEKGPLTELAYREALERVRRTARDRIDTSMQAEQLDALLAPTGGPAWVTDLVNGDHFGGGSSRPAAIAGYPNVTVPAGYVSGLPVGLSFFGRAWSEPTLIRLAYAFEQATRVRRPPSFLPTV